MTTDNNTKKPTKKNKHIKCGAKKIRYLVPKVLTDPSALKKQRMLLAKALWIRNLMFDDNLRYSNSDCSTKFNTARSEPNLQVQLSLSLSLPKEINN
jgi:hypothetical protein